jgi:hypothetical protein
MVRLKELTNHRGKQGRQLLQIRERPKRENALLAFHEY